MSFKYGISGLSFRDGTSVTLPETGVVAVVGPNNAGKSLALREVFTEMTQQPDQRPEKLVLDQVTFAREGSEADFEDWLDANAYRHFSMSGGLKIPVYTRAFASAPREHLLGDWRSGNPFMPYASNFLTFLAAAEGRLGMISEAGAFDELEDVPSQPLQVLYKRPELMTELSDTCFEAFGQPLTLSQGWGMNLRLHVGSTDHEPQLHMTQEYASALKQMPLLATQGDGMRGFMGLMLAVMTSRYRVIIVDEPEAFLHPPQARLLGKKLAELSQGQTQVLTATHDVNFLQGLIEGSGSVSSTIVRLDRPARGGPTRASVLERDRLKQLVTDPLLQMTNVLDGAFHRGVVVSESDADSLFYAASLRANRIQAGGTAPDLFFTQSGGKERLPAVAEALRSLNMPVCVIADFDVLRQEALVKKILEALGGDFGSIADDLKLVRTTVDSIGAPPLISAVQDGIKELLEGRGSEKIAPADVKAIRSIAKVHDPWRTIKQTGIRGLPQGDASVASVRLLESLATSGLFVVPVGELERWVPTTSGKSSRWVAQVLESRIHEDTNSEAAKFVNSVARFLSGE
jgi:hypothetical protein